MPRPMGAAGRPGRRPRASRRSSARPRTSSARSPPPARTTVPTGGARADARPRSRPAPTVTPATPTPMTDKRAQHDGGQPGAALVERAGPAGRAAWRTGRRAGRTAVRCTGPADAPALTDVRSGTGCGPRHAGNVTRTRRQRARRAAHREQTADEIGGGSGALQGGEPDLGEPLELDEVAARDGRPPGARSARSRGRRGSADRRRTRRRGHRGGSQPRLSSRRRAVAVPVGQAPASVGARCARAWRRAARPRWIRERTVPSLTPSVAAISS